MGLRDVYNAILGQLAGRLQDHLHAFRLHQLLTTTRPYLLGSCREITPPYPMLLTPSPAVDGVVEDLHILAPPDALVWQVSSGCDTFLVGPVPAELFRPGAACNEAVCGMPVRAGVPLLVEVSAPCTGMVTVTFHIVRSGRDSGTPAGM